MLRHPLPTSPRASRLPALLCCLAMGLCHWASVAIADERFTASDEPRIPQIEDLYTTDTVSDAITLSDGKTAIYCRTWVDPRSRSLRKALWRVEADGATHPLEAGEPDAFQPQLSPDGQWILFLSMRPFADGAPAFQPVPAWSDPAADVWLVPVTGGAAIPLGGPSKPYGRIVTDQFYSRVSYSPDGRRLVFVADDGRDPRTAEELRNNVLVVRDDQGEGYEGYGPMQVWVAELLEQPGTVAAAEIRRLTHDDYWYGDPQWMPDGQSLIVHANRTNDQESVRYSINRNYDLWRIRLADGELQQLTHGAGPDFSPRIAPDGRRLVCLTSPRNGPHMDVFNLQVVSLEDNTAEEARVRIIQDHHTATDDAPCLPPNYPLPPDCWRDNQHVAYNAFRGLQSERQCVNVDAGPEPVAEPESTRPAVSPLLPRSNSQRGPQLRAEDEVVRWTSSDGLSIEGVLTVPPPSIAKPPYKLLLMPHGGPHHRASSGAGFTVQIFAMHGYAVFQPNFRGSTGYGRQFLDANRYDFGGGDMQDLLTGIEYLVQRGTVDRQRQFVYGVSYGGYMTTWLVGQTQQFRAAVAQNAVTDLNVMWHLSDLQSWTEWDMGGLPWQVVDRMRQHSPLTHVAHVSTPTLILHSLNDRRCPVAMGRMFYRALRERGVPTAMVIYPDEGHGIRQLPHQEDVLRRTLDWFARHDLPTVSGQ